MLVALLVFPGAFGPGRPRDRHTRASLGVVDLEARPCPPVPPAPSTPAGPGVLTCACASPRSPTRPRRRPSISHVIPLRLVQTLNLHRWNCNVFGVSRKMTTINYVRNLGGGGVVAARGHRQPGPVGQAACLCETPVAFAGADRALSETGIAFAGAGRASTETGIAFAGEKWVFLAHFSVALVLSVSMVAVQGRAVVMVVSMSPRCCASWAKKFALRAQNGPKLACCGVLGEFFRGPAVVGTRRASLLRRTPGSRTHLLAVLTLQCAAKPT